MAALGYTATVYRMRNIFRSSKRYLDEDPAQQTFGLDDVTLLQLLPIVSKVQTREVFLIDARE
jgi:hypothetical protein